MRALGILLLSSTAPLSASGFVARSSRISGQSAARVETRLATTWSDYKHDHVDDLAAEARGGIIADATKLQRANQQDSASKAAKAEAYWESKVRRDKEKLRHMKSQQEVVGWYSHPASPRESWGRYRDALYALVPHSTHQKNDSFHWPKHPSVASWSEYRHDYVDGLTRLPPDMAKVGAEKKKDAKRAKADAFWESKYKQDKERLSHTKDDEAHHNDGHTETWGHYKHDYIDSLPRHKSIEAELNELRHQAAQFKALALAESIGHTLAEADLHEATERAVSCEIAEAVLLGASSSGAVRETQDGPSKKQEGGGFHPHV